MKFGRNQINKAGKIILSAREGKEYDSAMQKINEWRTLHLPALETLQVEVTSLLKSKGITFSLVSKRLKRISSIIYKLDLNPEMGLGGMQDIGGLRIVLDDINILKAVHSILLNNIPKSFEFIKVMDYVLYPKDSGYRSIHFMGNYGLQIYFKIMDNQMRQFTRHGGNSQNCFGLPNICDTRQCFSLHQPEP